MDLAPTKEQIATVLDQARAMIEKGWCAGKAKDGDRRCLVGALAEATLTINVGEDRVPGHLLFRGARAALEKQIPSGYENLPEFNDRTSQQQVIALLMTTADILRGVA